MLAPQSRLGTGGTHGTAEGHRLSGTWGFPSPQALNVHAVREAKGGLAGGATSRAEWPRRPSVWEPATPPCPRPPSRARPEVPCTSSRGSSSPRWPQLRQASEASLHPPPRPVFSLAAAPVRALGLCGRTMSDCSVLRSTHACHGRRDHDAAGASGPVLRLGLGTALRGPRAGARPWDTGPTSGPDVGAGGQSPRAPPGSRRCAQMPSGVPASGTGIPASSMGRPHHLGGSPPRHWDEAKRGLSWGRSRGLGPRGRPWGRPSRCPASRNAASQARPGHMAPFFRRILIKFEKLRM